MKTNNFVKKILKTKNKIVDIEQLKKMYQDTMDSLDDKKLYKQIYYLKNQGYILSLKKDLFYIKSVNDEKDVEDVVQTYYWKYLKKFLTNNFGNKYIIGGIKSLEIWNNNFSIPDKLIIINPYKRSKEVLFKDRVLQEVNYKIKGLDNEKSFSYFKKQTEKVYIDGKQFIVANYEFSLIESLYSVSVEDERYVVELIKKNIRKNHKRINIEVFEYFLKVGKYGSSIKRLYEISLGIRPDFAEKIRLILKKWYWM